MALSWPLALSAALHLALLLALLMLSPAPPREVAAEPITVDVVMEEGSPASAQEPATAPGAPSTPVQAAETPPPQPAPEPPPPAPVQEAAAPPPPPVPFPPPVQEAAAPPPPAPVPDPPPPIEKVETPPPAPPPNSVPPRPKPPVQARAPSPQRAAARPVAARIPADASGAPAPIATGGTPATGRVGEASNGAVWLGKLKQWWDQHSFYPREAAQTNEGGNIRVRIVIAPDGQVTSIALVQGSGSGVLDAAALAVFRGARLPPFPPGAPAPSADVVITLHYRPADSGG